MRLFSLGRKGLIDRPVGVPRQSSILLPRIGRKTSSFLRRMSAKASGMGSRGAGELEAGILLAFHVAVVVERRLEPVRIPKS